MQRRLLVWPWRMWESRDFRFFPPQWTLCLRNSWDFPNLHSTDHTVILKPLCSPLPRKGRKFRKGSFWSSITALSQRLTLTSLDTSLATCGTSWEILHVRDQWSWHMLQTALVHVNMFLNTFKTFYAKPFIILSVTTALSYLARILQMTMRRTIENRCDFQLF